MSMNFYTYRDGYVKAIGSHGPLSEDDFEMWEWMCEAGYVKPRTLEPSHEQEEAAGWISGPNFANGNARRIGHALGITFDPVYGSSAEADPAKVLEAAALILTGTAVEGFSHEEDYLYSAIRQIIPVCVTAIKWDTPLIVC